MTLFFIIASLLVVVCVLWLFWGVFRAHQATTNQEGVNITLARERRDTLQAALSDGAIDQATFDYENAQLAYDLAADLRPDEQSGHARKGGQLSAAIVIAAFIPIASGALYLQLGDPAAINQEPSPETAVAQQNQAPALADLLPRLEERLAASPDDIDGWRLLGRSYLSVNQFSGAQQAFEKALALDENDVDTLAQLAESIAMSRNGDLSGEPLAYLERAFDLNPAHEQTLWLLAIAQQQAGDHESALAHFEQLASRAAGNPEALATIEQMRVRSLNAMNTPSSSAPVKVTPQSTEQSNNVAIHVSVDLSAAVRSAVADTDSVFIYAKATTGPPMPLAVSKLQVKDLPVTVTLDDSMAMIPSATLSSYSNVTVGARISPSGNPIAQAGDWYNEKHNIDAAQQIELGLTIDTQFEQ